MHALAHSEPVYDAYFMQASRGSKKKLEVFCARCHTPLGVHAGEIPFPHALTRAGDTKVSRVAAEGVSCEFCHTMSGSKVGNSAYTLAPSNVKRAAVRGAKPVSHLALFDARFRSAELCGTCHQVIHPSNGIVLEDTYGEWKRGPYAKAGIICQDCHLNTGMVAYPAGTKAAQLKRPARRPGKVSALAGVRPHVSQHFFVGPNLIFKQGPKHARIRALSEALLRRAGKVQIRALKRRGKRIEVTLEVSNTGAGHYLPTGVTEVRELWLDVVVRDGQGKVLLHSGALDAAGNLGPEAVVYRTVVHDARGKDTTLFWNTVKKVRDRRIPPLASLTETLFAVLGGAKRVVVEAALKYRPVSPAGLAEAKVVPGSVVVPIFTISRCRGELKL